MNSNLPPNWSWTKLGEVADYVNGRAFKPVEWKSEGLPIIRIQNLNDHTAEFNYTAKTFEEKYVVQDGELLFAWSASLGAYIWNRGKAWLNQHIFKVIPKDFISKRFLFYTLTFTVNQFYSKTHGSGMVHITKKKFEETKIPLPPLPEQKKIVEKIEEIFSELDSGVASLKKAKEQISLYRQSVLASAFCGELVGHSAEGKASRRAGFLPDKQLKIDESGLNKANREMLKAAEPEVSYDANQLPEGWKWVKLGDIIESIQYGTSDKANGTENGIPVLRMGNIQDGKLDFTNLKFFDQNYEGLNKYLLEDGDLLFNRTNSAELVGKSALYKKNYQKSIFASYLIRVKINKSLYSPEFLNYYINSIQGRNYIKSVVSQQVGQANVNGTKLKNMPVLLLSLNQQTQIVEEIERRFSEADNLEKAIDESLGKAEALRQSILKKAFEGQLI